MINGAISRWNRFWFAPVDAINLGACRALTFAVIFWIYGLSDLSGWGEVSSVFWLPMWLFAFFKVPQPSTDLISTVQVIWRCALLTSCLGLATRISTIVAWLLGIYLLGLMNCYGKMGHGSQLIVMILGVLAVSHCGDAFSLDAAIKRWWKGSRQRIADGACQWPVRLVQLIFVLVFFAAGIAKLRQSGLGWVAGENLSNVLIKAHYGTEAVWNSLGLYIAEALWLCTIIAAASLLLELAAPLALFSRWARAIILTGLLSMQLGILVLMGTDFSIYLAGYVFWVPWGDLHRRWRPASGDTISSVADECTGPVA